ncbi:MAG TPA: hypothetical protein VGQ83_43000 [Polyangia bacterium]|jgi:hypothetical protein
MRGWSYLLLAGVVLTQHSLLVRPAAAQPKRKPGKKLALAEPARGYDRSAIRFERRAWRQSKAPVGDRFAQVKSAGGGERVVVDGAPLYPRRGGTRVVSNLVWSRDGSGLAFVERTTGGRLRLLVFPVLEMDEPLSWEIPDGVLTRAPKVTWMGPAQVGVGNSEVAPQVVARFTIERRK